MSQLQRPLLHEVIPVMDILERMLKGKAADRELHSAVRAAASLGCDVLNKYYAKTNDSILYRGANGKHVLSLQT